MIIMRKTDGRIHIHHNGMHMVLPIDVKSYRLKHCKVDVLAVRDVDLIIDDASVDYVVVQGQSQIRISNLRGKTEVVSKDADKTASLMIEGSTIDLFPNDQPRRREKNMHHIYGKSHVNHTVSAQMR
jgi:hypothetical protein